MANARKVTKRRKKMILEKWKNTSRQFIDRKPGTKYKGDVKCYFCKLWDSEGIVWELPADPEEMASRLPKLNGIVCRDCYEQKTSEEKLLTMTEEEVQRMFL